MPDTMSPPAAEPSPRHATNTSRKRRVALVLLTVLAFLLAGTGVAGGIAYSRLNSNITGERVDDRLGDQRPQPSPAAAGASSPLNVLLIGSDTRAGANGKYGRVEGARGDVTILLHLSADRSRAIGVSIPRDSVVAIPSCVNSKGETVPGGMQMFNDAYARGGAACTIRTVESVTGIRVDHHMVVDFAGFKNMVDALGTVRICLPRAVNDRDSGLNLSAGVHEVSGEQALGYVRVRHALGGSDIGRIERQQKFLSAMIQKATSVGVLTNPPRLYSFLDAATKSLTTDPGLASLNELGKLAQSVRNIGLDKIQFLTVPFEAYPADPNRVQFSPEAAPLWQLLRTDSPLPGKADAAASPTATPGAPSPTPVVSVAPKRVRVRVLNGTAQAGLANSAAKDLTAQGFSVIEVRSAPQRDNATTVVRYNAAFDESARTLAAATGATTELSAEVERGVELLLGADYAGVRPVRVDPSAAGTPTPSTPTFKARSADEDVCR